MEFRIDSTYRLQFSEDFRFHDAERIVPYLSALGVSALYASPYFRARPHSTHGYDVVDHNALNPEIGSEEEHRALIDACRRHGLAHIVDFVPNHMGVGASNPWWFDVLEWGERSQYARFFDIDWQPQREDLAGKVLLPFLGDHYGRVLERGEIVLNFDAPAGALFFDYYDLRFPLRPSSYAPVLLMAAELCVPTGAQEMENLARDFAAIEAALETAADVEVLRDRFDALKKRVAELVTTNDAAKRAVMLALSSWQVREDQPETVERLEFLLARQHYRLAFWRVALYEINYRRFFDINDLAGLRVEQPDVLAATHEMIFRMIDAGSIQGLRIDHVDGLYNPQGYCSLVRDRAAVANRSLYFVVEKVLARFERLHDDWGVDGTTGYDFMNAAGGLFIDPGAELTFDRIYGPFAPTDESYDAVLYACKQHIIRTKLASELTVLSARLYRIAQQDRRSNDFTYDGIREALAAIVASFPVYRTYVTGSAIDIQDREYIETATMLARRRSDVLDGSVFDFICSALTTSLLQVPATRYDGREVLHFAMKFQQFTGPVMAKAAEDTAYYRYVRLLSLNEVGGDPRRFGSSVSSFHHQNEERSQRFPRSMLATATHDHKRGEDTRLRISALSEMPSRWSRVIRTLARLGGRAFVDSEPAPSRNDMYALYQMILGTWPMEWLDGDIPAGDLPAYVERLARWMLKAVREAKLRSAWVNPNEAYEQAATDLVRRIFEPPAFPLLLREFLPVIRDAALIGMVSGLAQTVLKYTSPGVPDMYQGCELWDLSMVDPDNRRTVDFEQRARYLQEIRDGFARDPLRLAQLLFASWRDGRIKMFLTWRLLALRAERKEFFENGAYKRLGVRGRRAARIVAYARGDALVAVPRLVYPMLRLGADGPPALTFTNEFALLPKRSPRHWVNVFTQRELEAEAADSAVRLPAERLFADLPVAVLVPV